ncbi:Neurotrypsin [Holothuria leucospilota]|uniref:Neurotrypsin n=1 Tax=Holothuria leucospilota TaxID=206669 RepID=A0A9Q1BG30_HOLLE|nr:Neurotrypsin [Holothuria leucospilota]
MSNVQCRGNEKSILSCRHNRSQQGYCFQGIQASVVCEGYGLQGIRLIETKRHSSRVDIFYDNQWGLVCADDEWDLNDARVVCRQLGYDNATHISWDSSWKESATVWMSNVQCRGNETSISLCRHERFKQGNCSIGKYAGVICEEKSGYGIRGILLRDVIKNSSGWVTVLKYGHWGFVCPDDEWDLEDARVVCRQLGYDNAMNTKEAYTTFIGHVWMSNVQCRGNETSLSLCRHDRIFEGTCAPRWHAGVTCEGDGLQWIRLVGGFWNKSGRVEVSIDEEWGTVCDDDWDMEDAMVVCRELGYQRALGSRERSFFGRGSGTIWMDNVVCTGDETSLADCTKNPTGVHNCDHSEDAGVICAGNTNNHFRF